MQRYGDIATLREKNLIQQVNGAWRVHFAKREGWKPKLALKDSRSQETDAMVQRLRWMMEEEEVRPEDIQVLSSRKDRVLNLADAIEKAKIQSVRGIHVPIKKKDNLSNQDKRLGRRGYLERGRGNECGTGHGFCWWFV